VKAFATALLLVFLVYCAAAAAQLRTIPQDAKRGTMRHIQETIVEIDGQRERLSQGAQIRSQSNIILMPVALPPDSVVKYQLDQAGHVHRVWILTPQEAAQPDKR
jgi:hypothetical protein